MAKKRGTLLMDVPLYILKRICKLLEITGNENLVEMTNLYSWFFFRPKYIEIMYLHTVKSRVLTCVTNEKINFLSKGHST